MLGHPGLDLPQRLALSALGAECSTELRLSAGSLHVHHQPSGDGERDVLSSVLIYQRERQIHPGGHPGRGPDVAIAHEDSVRIAVIAG